MKKTGLFDDLDKDAEVYPTILIMWVCLSAADYINITILERLFCFSMPLWVEIFFSTILASLAFWGAKLVGRIGKNTEEQQSNFIRYILFQLISIAIPFILSLIIS